MRKINEMAVAVQEAFEYMNPVEFDDTPFWEVYGVPAYDEEEEFFHRQEQEFYNKYLRGHSWEEISSSKDLMRAYDFWSDLFKDAWGFRPRFLY